MKLLLSKAFKIWGMIFSAIIIVIKFFFPSPCFNNLWESDFSQQPAYLEWKSGVWYFLLFAVCWKDITSGATVWLYSQFLRFSSTLHCNQGTYCWLLTYQWIKHQVAWHLEATFIICIATYFWAVLLANAPQNWSQCPLSNLLHDSQKTLVN